MLEDKRDTRSRQLIVLLIFFLPKSGLKEKSAVVAVFNFLFSQSSSFSGSKWDQISGTPGLLHLVLVVLIFNPLKTVFNPT